MNRPKESNSTKHVPLISIVIPVYRDLAGLSTTIELIINELVGVAYELVVCNDGHDPSIAKWLYDNGIQHVFSTSQCGSYAMRNLGIEATSGEHLLFIDAGVLPGPGWWHMAKASMTKAQYIAFKINVLIPPKAGIFQQYSRYSEFTGNKYWEKHHFGPTAFLCVHRSVFAQLGLFDGTLLSGGDLELGNRCWLSGISMTYVQNDIIHHPSRTLYEKYLKGKRVLSGIISLKAKYQDRQMHLPKTSFHALIKAPWSVARVLSNLGTSMARRDGWPLWRVWIAELGHQLVYYLALTAVLLRRK